MTEADGQNLIPLRSAYLLQRWGANSASADLGRR